MLSEILKQEEEKSAQLLAHWQTLQEAYEQSQETRRQLEQQYNEIISMAEMYDSATMEAKKMIVSRMIERVDVGRDYHINLTFRQEFRKFFEILSEPKKKAA